ncbi:SPBc2 prophage-derived glycosyltransferase SunS [Caloramator mitchellensis]|uniref:SPBc2 prophage-derived glycosyltransferase SunS n=2 Tax=Caloramator mitchellensis TaxID=908809 RepID=A0A0R3JRB3_CALMK|nr:SPBc2 prophage-derived glycosyltransferase SunS [Caloramator mitchellensis]
MVKDEEKNIKKCLESIKKLLENDFAELVIVDTGSKDRTVEIAKEYTDKIYHHDWNNNFSVMRNISISYAKGEWILIIDADEEVENSAEIIELLKSPSLNGFNTIIINVKNLSTHNKNQYVVNASPRIFKNDGTFKYQGSVHNQPIFQPPIYYSNISLWHYGYILSDKNLMDKKFKRTSELLLNELKKNPRSLYYNYQLAVTYSMHGDKEEALNTYRNTYRLLTELSKQERKKYIYIYGAYARESYICKKYSETIEICSEGIELYNKYIDLFYLMGYSYLQINDIDNAIESFENYLNLAERQDELGIRKNLAVPLYNIDNLSKENVLKEIIRCYIKNKKYCEAKKYINRLEDENDKIMKQIDIYIETRNIENILSLYLDLNHERQELFEMYLENKIRNISEEVKFDIRKMFSNIDNNYGSFCNAKINGEINEIISLLRSINFNDSPMFYSELLKDVYLNNWNMFIKLIKDIETLKLKKILSYLLIDDRNLLELIKLNLLNLSVNEYDIKFNRVIWVLAGIYLNTKEWNFINEEEYKIFKIYLNSGMIYIRKIFQVDKIRIFINELENNEYKFLLLFYIIEEYVKISDFKSAIKYIKQALKINPKLFKFIDKYKEEEILKYL